MKIIYLSVHAILEYDEIRMFRRMGHTVFPLGSYFGGVASQAFRPDIDFGPELPDLMEKFAALGGRYSPDTPRDQWVIPLEFIKMFDVCVVMHDPDFIRMFWDDLSAIPVVWRTIGAHILDAEGQMLEFRQKGCKIVRYSPKERLVDGYIGEDALIRFPKMADDFHPRRRSNSKVALFANSMVARHPLEAGIFLEATAGREISLGGIGNDAIPGSTGLISYDQQLEILATHAAYFYAVGSHIPYTLNFMEAWLSGVPVVALNCHSVLDEAKCAFAEIPELITHGEDGFLVSSAQEAKAILAEIIDNPQSAERISAAGKARASSLFQYEAVAPLWTDLFSSM